MKRGFGLPTTSTTATFFPFGTFFLNSPHIKIGAKQDCG